MSTGNDFAKYAELIDSVRDRAKCTLEFVYRTAGCTPNDVYRIAMLLMQESKGERGKPIEVEDGKPKWSLADAELIAERFEAEKSAGGGGKLN